jgi:hypothetical protein
MSDDLHKRGKPDRDRVSANEPWEVNRLAKKTDMPAPLVKKIIQSEGPMRSNVERRLNTMKKNGRR